MKRKPVRLIEFNPCDMVEMPSEYREPARTWSPEQVGTFLSSCEADPLYWLYRLVLLHGPRRGEAVGARRNAFDHKRKVLRVIRPLLQFGGQVVESMPKTRAGERVLFLDDVTSNGIRRLLARQAKTRLAWGPAYEDNDLIFCREDGMPYSPDYVSQHFKDLAAAAGLPIIKLHEGRHTAATLRLEAGADIKVVSPLQHGHHAEPVPARSPGDAGSGHRRGDPAASAVHGSRGRSDGLMAGRGHPVAKMAIFDQAEFNTMALRQLKGLERRIKPDRLSVFKTVAIGH